jgi:cell shape-determining protein MreC
MYKDTLLIVCVKWYENLRLQVGDVSLLVTSGSGEKFPHYFNITSMGEN